MKKTSKRRKAKRAPIATHIKEGGKNLAAIMREGLSEIAEDLINQIMINARRATPAERVNAIRGVFPRGVSIYKGAIKATLAIIAQHAGEQVKKEVPKARPKIKLSEENLTLSEFDNLPPAIRKKITNQTNLLVGKQIGDLQKVIEFAYQTMEEETDSNDAIEADLKDSAIEWMTGTALEAGAELNSASIINTVRTAFFTDEDVLQEIDAFEFRNDNPVTEICQELNGTIFAKDDPTASQYMPPLHWNCKSYILPIKAGSLGDRETEKLEPSTKKARDQAIF